MSGRPLRFLGTTLTGWVAIRAVMLWPSLDSPGALPRLLIPSAQAEPDRPIALPATMSGVVATSSAVAFGRLTVAPPAAKPAPLIGAMLVRAAPPSAVARFAISPRSPITTGTETVPPFAAPIPGRPSTPRRWSATGWLVVRDGQGVGSNFGGGQLGGAQAGGRVAYAIDRNRRVSIVGRLTSPLHGAGREASIGVEWQPVRAPIRLVVERRFAIDGGKGGAAAGIIAGTGPAAIAFGFDLETYAQAGVIRRDRTEPFAEGAARLTRPVARAGHLRLDLGVGGWGAAQRDAQRLDIGPTVGVRLPLGTHTLRAIGDWRQRVAGHASPGSGPTLTIGADF